MITSLATKALLIFNCGSHLQNNKDSYFNIQCTIVLGEGKDLAEGGGAFKPPYVTRPIKIYFTTLWN